MAAVTLLAGGAKANSGVSTPLDVSAYTSLRLDASVQAYPQPAVGGASLQLWIEHASSATAPAWALLYYVRLRQALTSGPEAWPPNNVQRIVAGGFDSFVRVRWLAAPECESNGSPSTSTAGLQLGVSGQAQ